MVEMHPPPNFHAAAPASIPLNGPSIEPLLGDIETLSTFLHVLGKLNAIREDRSLRSVSSVALFQKLQQRLFRLM